MAENDLFQETVQGVLRNLPDDVLDLLIEVLEVERYGKKVVVGGKDLS